MANGLFNLKQVNQAIQQSAWSGQKPPVVEYLVVAGGGAGGGGYAGGGGGGGFLTGVTTVTAGSAITVTVGAGGTGGSSQGPNGSNSVFGSIVATGGGGGCSGQGSGSAGGSGGGNGGGPSTSGTGTIGSAVAGQGNPGGTGGSGTGPAPGGGGGAGSRGLNGQGEGPAGSGGPGAASAITGTVTAYAGGGGAGCYMRGASGYNGPGGSGGGGAGGDSAGNSPGTAGTANTGGGGGGASTNGGASNGGNGGSGIVVISYPDTYVAPTSTTGSPTVSTSGSGSMLLNGTTQTLTFASNAVFGMGTGDFTVEFWINTSDVSGDIVGVTGGFNLTLAANTMYWQSIKDVTNLYSISGSAITNGAWHHIAVCRSGTSNRIFYDGVAQGASPYIDPTSYGVSGNLVIGNGGVGYLAANISNLRIVKGTALYTSNFTPSTTPLTAVSGTSLLLSTISGGYLNDSSTNGFSPNSTTATAPTWSSLSPFTVPGYKNRVYTWTGNGSITF